MPDVKLPEISRETFWKLEDLLKAEIPAVVRCYGNVTRSVSDGNVVYKDQSGSVILRSFHGTYYARPALKALLRFAR